MPLPEGLRRAISTPGGGRVALILGAGCSVEARTNIPPSAVCSSEVYRRLVADGVLNEGDCSDPTNLSLVADAVFAKTGSQAGVVKRLRDRYELKLATPNDGISSLPRCFGKVPFLWL